MSPQPTITTRATRVPLNEIGQFQTINISILGCYIKYDCVKRLIMRTSWRRSTMKLRQNTKVNIPTILLIIIIIY